MVELVHMYQFQWLIQDLKEGNWRITNISKNLYKYILRHDIKLYLASKVIFEMAQCHNDTSLGSVVILAA